MAVPFPFYASHDSIDACAPPINHLFHNSSAPHDSPFQSMAAYEYKQMHELHHYIRLQNEKLRLLMHHQRRQQVAILLQKIESKALPLLLRKDEEITRAAKRTMELEDFLKRLEIENQAWQRAAQENEAMVVSLNSTIEQIRDKSGSAACCFDNGAEDAESCCEVIMNREEDSKLRKVCKGCNSRDSCVLFLPCRHLCSCKACEPFLESCPVCFAGKKATIEALLV